MCRADGFSVNLNISQATVGNAAGQAAPLRRVPGFTEPLNDLAPVARSSPRRAESVPSPSMAGNHQFLWQCFPSDYSAEYSAHTDARHHLIPPSSQGSHLRSFRPTATSSIQPLRPCGGGCPGRFFQHPVPGARHSRVLRRALLFRNTQFPYRPNPRPRIYTLCTHLRKSFWLPSTPKPKPRTFICCRCARLWKSSRLLSTHKIKLLMILTPRITRVLHVFSSKNPVTH